MLRLFTAKSRCSKVESPLSMCFLLKRRIFQLTPNRSLTAHTEWLAGIASTSLVQYIVRLQSGSSLVVRALATQATSLAFDC